MPDNATESRKVPFGPWKTFKSFIELDLKAKTIPAHIDSSLFRLKSGTDARQLRAALRFYGLVHGPKDDATDRLRALVASYGTETWKASVNDLLRSYDPLLGSVDLATGTQKQLEDAFRAGSDLSGSTLKKAVRLYLAMATEAGVSLSPHFIALRGVGDSAEPSSASAPAANGSKQKRKKPARPAGPPGDTTEQTVPDGIDAIQPLPGREFRVWIPRDLPKAELEFAMKYLRDYLKLTRGQDT
jgi:hypothetical protein